MACLKGLFNVSYNVREILKRPSHLTPKSDMIYVSDPLALYHIMIKEQDIYEEGPQLLVKVALCMHSQPHAHENKNVSLSVWGEFRFDHRYPNRAICSSIHSHPFFR